MNRVKLLLLFIMSINRFCHWVQCFQIIDCCICPEKGNSLALVLQGLIKSAYIYCRLRRINGRHIVDMYPKLSWLYLRSHSSILRLLLIFTLHVVGCNQLDNSSLAFWSTRTHSNGGISRVSLTLPVFKDLLYVLDMFYSFLVMVTSGLYLSTALLVYK